MRLLRNGFRFFTFPAIRSYSCNSFPMEVLMEKHHIMPDVLHETPIRLCDVIWEKTRSKANLGNILEPSRTCKQPCVQWISDVDRMYTILMLNPDMPHRSHPTLKTFVHWLVGNIPGPNVEEGFTIVEYVGPAPPKHTGLHRFVVLVYRQNSEISFDEKCLSTKMGEQRGHFNLPQFVKKHSLFGPLGVNYFLAEHDRRATNLLKMMHLEKLQQTKKKRGY